MMSVTRENYRRFNFLLEIHCPNEIGLLELIIRIYQERYHWQRSSLKKPWGLDTPLNAILICMLMLPKSN